MYSANSTDRHPSGAHKSGKQLRVRQTLPSTYNEDGGWSPLGPTLRLLPADESARSLSRWSGGRKDPATTA